MDNNKRKFVPFQAMIVRSGDGLVRDLDSLIPYLACVWMKTVSFKLQPRYLGELNPGTQLRGGLVSPKAGLEVSEMIK
jgi:hypothetical protein